MAGKPLLGGGTNEEKVFSAFLCCYTGNEEKVFHLLCILVQAALLFDFFAMIAQTGTAAFTRSQ
jgi:hypothetical protein